MEKQEIEFMLTNLINALVKDEWDAVEGYNGAIATLTDQSGMENVISVLTDIRDEEYVHIGQLESCLSLLKGDPVKQIEDGNDEGFEQLELPEEDDEETEDEIEDDEIVTESTTIGESKKSDIDDLDIDEVKRRLLAVGFDRASFIGKSDKEIRAMLKINRRARGDNYLRTWSKERRERVNTANAESLEEETVTKSSKLSEKEMKKIICDMITKYDASEEEVFDELQSQDPRVTRDVAHRLFKMCNKSSVPECVEEDFDFDKTWEDLNDIED